MAYDTATGMAYDTATVDITVTHKHLLVPLTAGFSILKSEKLSLTPRAGIDLSFNLGSQSKWEYADGRETTTRLNGPGNPNSTFSVLGHVSVMLAYHINSHIAITAEPVFYHPILPMKAGISSRNYALTGNLGLLISL